MKVRSGSLTAGAALFLLAAATAARAIPPPAPPRNAPAEASPTPAPAGRSLPFGSPLYFVLDAKISSGSTPDGTLIPMHLKSPLIVNGVVLAPAGTPANLEVVSTRKPASGDVNGAVQIHLEPLALPGRGRSLPIRAIHEYLTPQLTSGQESTRGVTDTLGDIFIPYHIIYHAFRPGRQFVAPAGSILRAETAATIDARNPAAVVIATPLPFMSTYDAPHANLTPAPFYTAPPTRRPLPHGRPTLPPTPSPSPSPSEEASSAPQTPPPGAPQTPPPGAPQTPPPGSTLRTSPAG